MAETIGEGSRKSGKAKGASRAAQRQRVVDAVAGGSSYRTAARDAATSVGQARKIVVAALSRDKPPSDIDHQRVQLLRLDPALEATAAKVGQGDARAVIPMLRVLEHLDKYQQRVGAAREQDAFWRQKLIDRLDRASQRKAEEDLRPKSQTEIDYNLAREAGRSLSEEGEAGEATGETDV